MKRITKQFFSVMLLVLISVLPPVFAASETTTYYHTDALGSVVAATDEAGGVVWTKTYDSFGREVFNTASGKELEEQAYTGKPYDDETGLVYLGQRYYDPELKRFLSIDPVSFNLGNMESFNPYIYGNNNPYKFIDPDGRQSTLFNFDFGGKPASRRMSQRNLSMVDRQRPTDVPRQSFGQGVFMDATVITGEAYAEAGATLAVEQVAGVGTGKAISVVGGKVIGVVGARFATKGGGNNLFRVVDDVELADIKKTGAFRSPAGTLEEGKQFVDNIGDAKALQSKFSKFFGGNQTIVGAKAPQSVLNGSTKQPFADIPKGQAITVPVKSLPKVKPDI